MAMNLRLPPEAEQALRAEAERTGQSQQEIVRAAVSRHLRLVPDVGPATELDALVASGAVLRPRRPYRKVTPTVVLPAGVTSLDLLDRDDRF